MTRMNNSQTSATGDWIDFFQIGTCPNDPIHVSSAPAGCRLSSARRSTKERTGGARTGAGADQVRGTSAAGWSRPSLQPTAQSYDRDIEG